jgi:hypothetical protein
MKKHQFPAHQEGPSGCSATHNLRAHRKRRDIIRATTYCICKQKGQPEGCKQATMFLMRKSLDLLTTTTTTISHQLEITVSKTFIFRVQREMPITPSPEPGLALLPFVQYDVRQFNDVVKSGICGVLHFPHRLPVPFRYHRARGYLSYGQLFTFERLRGLDV